MSAPLSFEEVLQQEHQVIRLRRQLLDSDAAELLPAAVERPAAGEPTDTTRPPAQGETACPCDTPAPDLLDDAFALALSGGGIRSASFNLGVLQAFAEQRLISNLDYLSTVSGGGYIGSWLAGWIYRDGDVKNVEQLMVPDRSINAKAMRDIDGQRKVDAARVSAHEPSPLSHLRANSNYLAPRPGLFTPESWALIAIYLRNIFLNSLVVLPTLLAIVFLTRSLVVLYAIEPLSRWWHVLHMVLAVYLVAVSQNGVVRSLQLVRDEVARAKETERSEPAAKAAKDTWNRYFNWLVIWNVAAAYFISLDIADRNSLLLKLLGPLEKSGWADSALSHAVWLGLIFGLLHLIPNYRSLRTALEGRVHWEPLMWLAAGFGAGFVMGMLTYGTSLALQSMRDIVLWGSLHITAEVCKALLGVPMLIGSFFIAESIQVGILSSLEFSEVREKWSAFQARLLMASVAWFVLILHVFVLSQLFVLPGHFYLTKLIPAATWAVSALGTLRLAHSSSTQGRGSAARQWQDLLVMAGPPIFFSGLIAGLSALVVFGQGHNWLYSKNVPDIAAAILMLLIGFMAGLIVDINIFSLQEMYEGRLVRCFLGASRPSDDGKGRGAPFHSEAQKRRPDVVTAMAPGDDLKLSQLRTCSEAEQKELQAKSNYKGPLLLVNTTVNLTRDIDLARQERKADSFTLSPIACGTPLLDYRPTRVPETIDGPQLPNVIVFLQSFLRTVIQRFKKQSAAASGAVTAQAETACQTPTAPPSWAGYGNGLNLGTAMALSGAAVSPNMGYYSSPMVTALLTIFNLRLGAWLGNPRKPTSWRRRGPYIGWLHLVKETMGLTDATSKHVYISDGGHFDNLGVYELLRRRCKVIFASDAGADPIGSCNELGMIIRKAFVDFGIDIQIDTTDLAIDEVSKRSKSSIAVGTVHYPELTLPSGKRLPPSEGVLIYIKMTLTGEEPTDVLTYQKRFPDFPHQSTLDQFYSESQFESYRHLGLTIAREVLGGKLGDYPPGHPRQPPAQPRSLDQLHTFIQCLRAAESLRKSEWPGDSYSDCSKRYAGLRSRLYRTADLSPLLDEVQLISKILDVSENLMYGRLSLQEQTTELARRQNLYQQWIAAAAKTRTDVQLAAERAWVVEATSLLDDVMTYLDMDEYHSVLRAEWMRVIRNWMHLSTFGDMWPNIKSDFVKCRDDFVCALRADDRWMPSEGTGPQC